MDEYRRIQQERWKDRVRSSEPEAVVTLDKWKPTHVQVDNTSLESIITFLKSTEGRIPRTGILYGAPGIVQDGMNMVVVDAIYECSQDVTTGEPLWDSRENMVSTISGRMGLHPVGILITTEDPHPRMVDKASHLIRACKLHSPGAPMGDQGFCVNESHIILIVSQVGPEYSVSAVCVTDSCREYVAQGTLHEDTSLAGQTARGGLDGTKLQFPLEVLRRSVNLIIHTGFYRLNRPNHTPTMEDVAAYIIARRDRAQIAELHKQLADYHLILFIADTLGESAAERIIISIFTEEDELVTDLIDLLLSQQ